MPAFVTVLPVPLFEDNYAWLVRNEASKQAVLVDPADAGACLAAARQHAELDGYELVGALTTHHHWDHAGGNVELLQQRPGLTVVAGSAEAAKLAPGAATKLVGHDERFELAGVAWRALHVPFHTLGHVAYAVDASADQPPLVFTGDALFLGGCGRFFEGTAAQALASLRLLASLPPATRVYCGHEYTVANLRFCAHVEPANEATRARLTAAQAARAAGTPTVPGTIAEELATNVFLRTGESSVRAFTHSELPMASEEARRAVPEEEVLARLREAKNAFKG